MRIEEPEEPEIPAPLELSASSMSAEEARCDFSALNLNPPAKAQFLRRKSRGKRSKSRMRSVAAPEEAIMGTVTTPLRFLTSEVPEETIILSSEEPEEPVIPAPLPLYAPFTAEELSDRFGTEEKIRASVKKIQCRTTKAKQT